MLTELAVRNLGVIDELVLVLGPGMEEAGLICSGTSPDGRLVEFVELADHPWWVGTQAHPEFKSRPDRPGPLFRDFIGAAVSRAEGRNPHLLSVEA